MFAWMLVWLFCMKQCHNLFIMYMVTRHVAVCMHDWVPIDVNRDGHMNLLTSMTEHSWWTTHWKSSSRLQPYRLRLFQFSQAPPQSLLLWPCDRVGGNPTLYLRLRVCTQQVTFVIQAQTMADRRLWWSLFVAACFCVVALADDNCDYATPQGKVMIVPCGTTLSSPVKF